MSDCVRSCVRPLQSAHLLTATQHDALFQNFDELTTVAHRYEAALRRCSKRSPQDEDHRNDLTHVGERWRQAFAAYSSGLRRALNTFDQLRRSRPDFAEFVRSVAEAAQTCPRQCLLLPASANKCLRQATHVATGRHFAVVLGEL